MNGRMKGEERDTRGQKQKMKILTMSKARLNEMHDQFVVARGKRSVESAFLSELHTQGRFAVYDRMSYSGKSLP